MPHPDAPPESSPCEFVFRHSVLLFPVLTSTTTWYVVLAARSMPPPDAMNWTSPKEPVRLSGLVSVASLPARSFRIAPGLPELSSWMLTL